VVLYSASVVAHRHEEAAKSVCMLNSDVVFDHSYRRNATAKQTAHAFIVSNLFSLRRTLLMPTLVPSFGEGAAHMPPSVRVFERWYRGMEYRRSTRYQPHFILQQQAHSHIGRMFQRFWVDGQIRS